MANVAWRNKGGSFVFLVCRAGETPLPRPTFMQREKADGDEEQNVRRESVKERER